MKTPATAVWTILALGLVFPSSSLFAQPPAPPPPQAETIAKEDPNEASKWIAQLGADSFRLRESATARLLRIGPRAIPELAKAKEQSDPEMRERIQAITERILKDDFEQRIKAFLDKEPDSELPGWKYVAQRIPDRQTTRELFVEMSKLRPGVTGLLEGSNQNRTQALSILTKEIGNERLQLGFTPSPADAILLLILVTDAQVPTTASDDAQVIFMVRRPEITARLTDPELSDLLRSLLGAWIVEVNPSQQVNVLAFTMERGIADGLTLAKSMLDTDTSKIDTETIEFALMAIARFGTPNDASSVKSLLEDKRPTSDEQFYVDPTGRALKAEVRDEAMATIACLYDQPLRSLGFPVGQEHPLTGFARETIGFPEGETGEQARARVRQAIEDLIEKNNSNESNEKTAP